MRNGRRRAFARTVASPLRGGRLRGGHPGLLRSRRDPGRPSPPEPSTPAAMAVPSPTPSATRDTTASVEGRPSVFRRSGSTFRYGRAIAPETCQRFEVRRGDRGRRVSPSRLSHPGPRRQLLHLCARQGRDVPHALAGAAGRRSCRSRRPTVSFATRCRKCTAASPPATCPGSCRPLTSDSPYRPRPDRPRPIPVSSSSRSASLNACDGRRSFWPRVQEQARPR